MMRVISLSSGPDPVRNGLSVCMNGVMGGAVPAAPRSMQFSSCRLPGCYLLEFPTFRDDRGLFVKTMQRSAFQQRGLECDFTESFYTESGENVLRGMHFQVPPADHAKVVYCLSGAIWDVALDLRVGSPTFGEHEIYQLSAERRNAVYLPRGIAHGFYVLTAPSRVVYEVTSEHSPAHDRGVRWDSFGAAWPHDAPIVSERDQGFADFIQFQSRFRFDPGPSQTLHPAPHERLERESTR
jgi:dTDP-4-dehydrorhamnose 3,5-epimerase